MGWPGEQLLIRLWDTLTEKAIGSLLKPWQIRREGLAHIEVRRAELLALAETERDAEDIRTGRKALGDFSQALEFAPVSAKSKQERAEAVIDLPTAARVSACGVLADGVRKEVNVAKAIIHAEDELKEDQHEAPPNKIDDDWLYRWRDYAGGVSSEDMQLLWGRLLAGELKSPGSFSLRCLDFLRNLSQDEAKEITRMSRFVVEDVIWRDNRSPLESEGITFSFLVGMQNLGIVSGVDTLGINRTWKTSTPQKFMKALRSNGKVLVIKQEDPEKEIKLDIYLLTALGRQILQLGKFEPHIGYLRQIGKVIQDQGFTVTLADYIQVTPSTIRVLGEEPISAQQDAQPDSPAADRSAT